MKINIVGTILGSSGYDSHTRNLANALYKVADCKLSTQIEQGWERLVNDAEFNMIMKPERKDDWNIIITTPHNWKLYLGHGKNACYCVWEGDKVPKSWIEEFENPKVDLILVPSNHTRDAIINTATITNSLRMDIIDKIKIIPHGVNREVFYSQRKKVENEGSNVTQLETRSNAEEVDKTEHRTADVDNHADSRSDQISKPTEIVSQTAPFIFICNKGWRGTNWDRGGVQYLLKAFAEEFSKKDNVKLIVKLNPAYIHPAIIKQSVNNLNLPEDRPLISIVSDVLPAEKLSSLYNSADCYVCCTRAESFDLGSAEAMACGIPCLTSGYGGQTDHVVSEENGLLFDYDLVEVSEDIMYEGIAWCIPKHEDIKKKLRWMYENRNKCKEMGNKAAEFIKNNFTWDLSANKIVEAFQND